jgi:hypothetical protein
MKGILVFSGSGPLLILSSYPTIDHPDLIAKLKAKGLEKFMAWEIPLERCRHLYGFSYRDIVKDLATVNDIRVPISTATTSSSTSRCASSARASCTRTSASRRPPESTAKARTGTGRTLRRRHGSAPLLDDAGRLSPSPMLCSRRGASERRPASW